MTRLTDSEYLRLGRVRRFLYRVLLFLTRLPRKTINVIGRTGRAIKNIFLFIKNDTVDILNTFKNGDYKTRISYVIMGFGSAARGQIARGILFFLFEAVFVFYMVFSGGHWLSKLDTLGDISREPVYDEIYDTWVTPEGFDNSFKILLYGLLTVFFIIAFVYTWRLNVKQNKISEQILKSGKKLKKAGDDLRALVDEEFHKTLLALPTLGILLFTVIPICFMVLVAFTNYDGAHDGYSNLFTWVGFENFNQLIGSRDGVGNLGYTFGEILSWTLIWAVLATFTNYFLGMLVAIMINKRGIKFKKFWRGVLVLTIAVPQFVSLLYISRAFGDMGIVNGFLQNIGIISEPFRFWKNELSAKILLVVINIWVGIPHIMLMATGILMNIPNDLYESSKIDGAGGAGRFFKITLPYMLFVTGPYLLTNFIGNINNFNVIYLLTNGQTVQNPDLFTSGGVAYDTDLLITWLFRITTGETSNYKLAAVIGILIFLVVAILSLVIYNLIPSTRNEEDFQ